MAWILQFRPASLVQGWNPYVVSLAATALSAATYLALLPVSGERTLYVVFLPAAVAAALIGGFGPAMVAVASSSPSRAWPSPSPASSTSAAPARDQTPSSIWRRARRGSGPFSKPCPMR